MLLYIIFVYCSVDEQLVNAVNKYREENGKKPCKVNSKLAEAAKIQCDYCAKIKQQGHNGPPGNENLGQRIKNVGYGGQGGAENAAVSFDDKWEQPLEAWKNSPGHNKNMLGDYSETGLASAKDNNNTRYYIQVFSNPINQNNDNFNENEDKEQQQNNTGDEDQNQDSKPLKSENEKNVQENLFNPYKNINNGQTCNKMRNMQGGCMNNFYPGCFSNPSPYSCFPGYGSNCGGMPCCPMQQCIR